MRYNNNYIKHYCIKVITEEFGNDLDIMRKRYNSLRNQELKGNSCINSIFLLDADTGEIFDSELFVNR